MTPAPKSAKGKSTTTAKKAGVKARKVTAPRTLTADAITARYATVRALSMSAGTRPANPPTGAFLSAILSAMKAPALPADIQGKSPRDAGKRREWCAKHKAPKVTTADTVHPNRRNDGDTGKVEGIVHDRPENTVLASLKAFSKVMGYAPDKFRAVRAEGYEEGTLAPIYIVRNH